MNPSNSHDPLDTGNTHRVTTDDLVTDNGASIFRTDRVMNSLRYAEYDVNSTIAELVDNSIEGRANNTWIFIQSAEEKAAGRRKSTKSVTEIAVVDDGDGMSLDVLQRALVLGESARPVRGTKKGIGRFGVGLTLGGISIARRIELYSRDEKNGRFMYTYLDLDEIERGQQKTIPKPIAKAPPAEYAALITGSTGRGTVVVLQKCDRLGGPVSDTGKKVPVDEIIAGLPYYLGRTYRKFLAAGRKVWMDGKPVYLHDPLFLASPTKFEAEGKAEPKAQAWGNVITIPLDVPGTDDIKADVTIRMTLLPKEWRSREGMGGSKDAEVRHIPDNEGISILRADREVLYGVVPYLVGKRGEATTLDIDRWWGCEISFPPELDEYFHVRFIKRGAEPIQWLRDQIREHITAAVKDLRKIIREDFNTPTADEAKTIFASAEEAMADAERLLPSGTLADEGTTTPADVEKQLDDIVRQDVTGGENKPEEEIQEKKEKIRGKPYVLTAVRLPAQIFFETVHMPGQIVVQLNVNHPFYTSFFQPLCGQLKETVEDSENQQVSRDQQRIRDAFLFVLCSYAKAEAMMGGDGKKKDVEILLRNLRAQWGSTLATFIESGEKR